MTFNNKPKPFELKLFVVFILFISFQNHGWSQKKPNVIFILSDDIGYDVLSVNGNKSYSTPNIDSMAHHGINFTHCEATPLCSPSRFMLLTGKSNLRNYSNWGYMSDSEKTFGNVMKDAGYKTGFFGKLQLPFSNDTMAKWGFDKFDVFSLTENNDSMARYKNPSLVNNNGPLPDDAVQNKYCDDILTDNVKDFIDSNVNNPFFIYYSMSIGHHPFSPTPDDTAFANWDPYKDKSDTSFFRSMVHYMDFEVGRILKKLKETGLDKNTIVIFSGDNGTPDEIFYDADASGDIEGEKGLTTEKGTHVPLIAYWPSWIKEGQINEDLIDFSDFLPTFAEAANVTNLSKYGLIDGLSFYQRMLGIKDNAKQQLFFHYWPHPGFGRLKRWVMDKNYKLYDSSVNSAGAFYNIVNDPEEKSPLKIKLLTGSEKELKARFQRILDSMPDWPLAPEIDSPFITNVTANSVTLGATVVNSGASYLIDMGSTLAKVGEPYLNSARTHDLTVRLGKFTEDRSLPVSETLYKYSLYAMNASTSHSTTFAEGSFYSLSAPPILQPAYFSACNDTASILLNWCKAKFPGRGATNGGYALFYSTDSIQLIESPNGKNPSKITKNGTYLALNTTQLPAVPDTFVSVRNLSQGVAYHFLIVPFTYNGLTDSTCNYLTAGALTLTIKPTYSQLSLNIAAKDPVCYQQDNGDIVATAFSGTEPYVFSLNNKAYTSNHNFRNLNAGSYSLKVKDNSGCIDSQTIILADPTAIQLKTNAVSAVCYGDTASIAASAEAGNYPYKYALNNSAYNSDSVFNNLLPGTYSVKVKDASGCIDSESVVLSVPEQIQLSTSAKDEECLADGQITASASNGIKPYLFNFNNGGFDTVSQFTGLKKGNYAIKVKDSNKCTASVNVVVKSSPQNCFTGITVLPNPSNSEFLLRIGNNQRSNHIIIKVYDVEGKLVYLNYSSQTKSYSFGKNFMTGVYFVKVEVGNANYNLKIIKE